MICRLCRVTGRVQGVYFRGSTAAQARRLGITGHARNLADGSVEVLACGEAQAVAELLAWLGVGPEGAVVKGVEELERPVPVPPPAGFVTG